MNNLEKIKKPIMVVAGRNDPRVPVSESNQIFAALRKQGTGDDLAAEVPCSSAT